MPAVEHILNELLTVLDDAGCSYHRLVLLIGPSNSGKTQVLRQVAERLGCNVLNVNLEFSQRMLDVPKSRIPKQADRISREIVASRTGDTVLLDNLEDLFAFQRVVRSMVEWNTLADAEVRGHFTPAATLTTKSKPLQMWLLRASHAAEGTEMIEAAQLLSLPSCFPFKTTVSKTDLRRSKDFTFHRQGLDMDMVATVSNNGAPKTKTSKRK